MDDKHRAFWLSVITDNENVIETNKELQLSIIFEGEEFKYKATDWNEVTSFYNLLIGKRFEEIKDKITKVQQ